MAKAEAMPLKQQKYHNSMSQFVTVFKNTMQLYSTDEIHVQRKSILYICSYAMTKSLFVSLSCLDSWANNFSQMANDMLMQSTINANTLRWMHSFERFVFGEHFSNRFILRCCTFRIYTIHSSRCNLPRDSILKSKHLTRGSQ